MKKSVEQRRRRNRAFIEAVKAANSCQLCGKKYQASAMDFHHVDPASKKGKIGDLAKSYSLDTLVKEIEKCIVVCACCHRIVHHGKVEINPYSINSIMEDILEGHENLTAFYPD